MPLLMPSSTPQRLFSATIFGVMCLLLAYVSHLFLFGWHDGVEALVKGSGHGREQSVLKYVNPKIGTYGVTPNGMLKERIWEFWMLTDCL